MWISDYNRQISKSHTSNEIREAQIKTLKRRTDEEV